MKSVLEEFLPFAVLIAISAVGKIMERAKSKAPASSEPVPVPTYRAPTLHPARREVDDEPMEIPRHPEAQSAPKINLPKPVPMQRPTGIPPVADMPEPLRNLMRMITPAQPKVPVAEVPVPHVEVKHGETRTRVHVKADAVEIHAKPVLELTPHAVRQGMLWKSILDEPRYKHPWQPLSK